MLTTQLKQRWTLEDAIAIYAIGLFVTYHNGKVILGWEESE